MGVTAKQLEQLGYKEMFRLHKMYLSLLNGKVEQLISYDAYQFDNYADYAASNFIVALPLNPRSPPKNRK